MKSRLLGAVCICIMVFTSTNAAALPLESRLGGLAFYDPNLNITWAANANINGRMDWFTANTWVSGLSTTLSGITGWRLPIADLNADGTVVNCSGGGVTGCADNEMGFLYWEEGITSAAASPFSNVQSGNITGAGFYWSSTRGTGNLSQTAHGVDFEFGFPGNAGVLSSNYAWPVRDGDVLGMTQLDPILPDSGAGGEWTFRDFESGMWSDPPTAEGYTYTMDSASLFAGILGFPTGFNSPFEVLVGESSLGLFNPGDQVDFGTGVSSFTIMGIDPLVDPDDPSAFPLQLEFNTALADFSMSAVNVPIPAAFWLFGSGLLGLIGITRRKKAA